MEEESEEESSEEIGFERESAPLPLVQGNWLESESRLLWTVDAHGVAYCNAERTGNIIRTESGFITRTDGLVLDVEHSNTSRLVWKMDGKPSVLWTSAQELLGQAITQEEAKQQGLVALQINDTPARDLRPYVQHLPVFGMVLMTMYAGFWAVLLLTPFTIDEEMTCNSGVPRSANILFGGVCFAMTITELMMASLSERGQRLMKRKSKVIFLVFLSLLGRFDPYGDVSFIAITRKCDSDWWKYALGIFLFGVVILQTLPGFYFMLRFVLYQEDPFKALTYSDFYILVETIDPSDAMVEVPVTGVEKESLQKGKSKRTPQNSGAAYVPLLDSSSETAQTQAAGSSTAQTSAGSAEDEHESDDAEEGQDADYDQDEFERQQFKLKQEAQADAEKELKEALLSRDTSALIKAIESANRCDFQGQPLTNALDILDGETKLTAKVGDVKRLLGTIRFIFEDFGQGALQSMYLYENWSDLPLANKAFTLGSISAGLIVSLSNPIRAWLSRRSAHKHLEMRIKSELQTAMNAGDVDKIRRSCSNVSTMIPPSSALQKRINAALQELPEPDEENYLKVLEAHQRVAQILNGEGRPFTVDSLKRKWASTQGFYHLIDSYPAGLLVLVKLEEDVVTGQIVLHAGTSPTNFKDQRVPLFEIRLMEADNDEDDAKEVMSCLGVDIECVTMGKQPSAVPIAVPQGQQFFAKRIGAGNVFAEALNPSRYPQFLTIKLVETALNRLNEIASKNDLSSLWGIWARASGGPDEANLSPNGVRKMLASLLLAKQDCNLVFGMVRGPSANRSSDPSVPHIKPGLYAGDYGEGNYGKFRRETLLVEYNEIDLNVDYANFERLFRRQIPHPFDKLRADDVESGKITVVSGLKVTGDVHVPMGQVTWVALVQPSYGTLNIEGLGTPPPRAKDSMGKVWEVLRAWPGVGTLAGPGFFGQWDWDFGWLLMVGEGRSTRFAFCWTRFGDEEAIVLSWVKAQDQAKYLQLQKGSLSSMF